MPIVSQQSGPTVGSPLGNFCSPMGSPVDSTLKALEVTQASGWCRIVGDQHAPSPSNGQRLDLAPPQTQQRRDLREPPILWRMGQGRDHPLSSTCLSIPLLLSPLKQSIFWLQPLRQIPTRASFCVGSRRPGRVYLKVSPLCLCNHNPCWRCILSRHP